MFGWFNRRERKRIELLEEAIRQHGIIAAHILESAEEGQPLSHVSRLKLTRIAASGEEVSEAYEIVIKLLGRFKEQRDVYENALQRIHNTCGAICPDFMECNHAACSSSAFAHIAAGDALKKGIEIAGRDPRDGERWSERTIGPVTLCIYHLALYQIPRLAISENGARKASHFLAVSLQLWRTEVSLRVNPALGPLSLLTRWIPDNRGRGYSLWVPLSRAGLSDVIGPHEYDKVKHELDD